MIVIINSFDFSWVLQIVKGLAARFEAGAVLNTHKMAAGFSDRYERNIQQDFPFDGIDHQVLMLKKRYKQNFVGYGTFEKPDTIKRLRIMLSAYDDEIYVFRLNFRLTKDMVENLEFQNRDKGNDLLAVYSSWLEKQENGSHYGDMGYEIIVTSTDPLETVTAVWDDIHAPVELVAYNQCWPEMFSREKLKIISALKDTIIDVEHIGSTAIAPLVAKPVIDILITVRHLKDAPNCIRPLRELGYAFIDYPQNTDRLFFRKGNPRSHHIHIVEKGSGSERDHIRFRDVLLTHKDFRDEYLKLKQDAMHQYRSRRARYGERKKEFIERALSYEKNKNPSNYKQTNRHQKEPGN